MTINALFFCLFSLVFISIGCDRIKEIVSMSPVTESREISIESLIERMMENKKTSVEEEHKKGKTNTVGLLDGKMWLEDSFDRYGYLRGIADLVSANVGVAAVVLEKVNEQERMSLQSARKNQSRGAAALDAIRIMLIRLSDVTGGRPLGDTVDAVTRFYDDKPLLKDRPVIWVLAVPLYKQLQEAKPPDQRDNKNDTVPVPTMTKQKEKGA
jgi:hypothetical protein